MCHEISNSVAAVRLQAHLIDEELDAKALAVASVELDDLAARSSALLALVRPVLDEPRRISLPTKGDAVFAALSRTLSEQGGRGARLCFESDRGLPAMLADPEVIHFLLLAQVFCALDAVAPGGTVRLGATRKGAELLFVVEDDGTLDEEQIDWRGQSLRGRSLACAVADHVLAKRGGRFTLERRGGLTRAELCLPAVG
jgi:signal transduction histidine kinase